ncbi:unnamed protein product [Danaus chrysippus]|uniref:diacylglycerol O-acyltransferase n=1 Tax=Danaus chrysippus TaxID=151541 RepID=A0A8J2QPA1_9NEOP|nr:unnamed protein product [Danaus chrysippus]
MIPSVKNAVDPFSELDMIKMTERLLKLGCPKPLDLVVSLLPEFPFVPESNGRVSVPLQMFRIWAFLGMMVQPPLSIISKLVKAKVGSRWGNIIVWSSLILGQPLAIMMYYHDYALEHFNT